MTSERIKFIVGITGGSGVGKTTLIKKLYHDFSGRVSTFSLDNYYLPKEHQWVDENGVINFDLPTALDQNRIQMDLTRLVEGHPIEQEVYAFNNPDAGKHKLVIEPKELLIVEGLFVMHYPFVKEVLNYSVYLSVKPELQLERRILRDVNERNYTESDILYQWHNHVIPSYHSFVQPHKEKSDLIITNNDRFDENIHVLTDIISKNLELKNEPKI
ncbi:MAG: AAA family ATPase [Crocinitomicaceae bacterium]|nr:AAA family ATPase [Crocinitomicaceae bacterium]